MSKPILVALVLALACCWPMAASAQGGDNIVQPTEAQFQLYEEGFEAFRAEDYAKAIDLFKASLHLGELNITYLNLGRAHYKLGHCAEASDAYARALEAPRIAQPTPAQVAAKIREYQQDMINDCPATLVVECASKTTRVSISGKGTRACDGTPWELAPGRYTVSAQIGGADFQEEVVLTAMQKATVRFGTPGVADTGPKVVKGGDGKGPARPTSHARLSLGLKAGTVLSGSASATSTLVIQGESASGTADLTEGSGLGANVFGLYRLTPNLGLGASVWFFPSVTLASTNDDDNVANGARGELDLNVMAMVGLPLRNIESYAFGEVGLASLSAAPGEPTDERFVGLNFGGGFGVGFNFGDLRLFSDLRIQFYELSRTFTQDGVDVSTDVSGQRVMLGFGAGYDLF